MKLEFFYALLIGLESTFEFLNSKEHCEHAA